ncbi:glycosyltransferase [Chthonobacter rhizosphaerae]|uniref:glycosyltransferase n=1 Tax=Chthonobacter rhizosphaerae TaxID=2735553 RepID=UPI0015EFD706|nr:glycosyltransferase [Chthonobacter rhizosphaerae]
MAADTPETDSAKRLVAAPDAMRLIAGPDAKRLAAEPDAKRLVAAPDAMRLVAGPDAKRLPAEPDAKRLPAGPDAMRLVAGLVDRRLVLAFGRHPVGDGATPVRVGADGAHLVEADIAGWSGPDGAGALILLPIPRGLRGSLSAVAVDGEGGPVVHPVQPKAVPVEAVLKSAAAAAGAAFPTVAGRLASALLKLEPFPDRTRLAAVLAHAAATPGGLVEAIGRFAAGDLMVKGWAGDLPGEPAPVVVLAPEPRRGRLAAVRFPRADLPEGRRGYAGVLAVDGPVEAAAATAVLVETASGWRALDLYRDRLVVEPDACPGHLAAHLAEASGPPETAAAVRAAACRFAGRDTLSEVALPVRLGVDRCLALPGGGLALCGWLFDPERRVRAVMVGGGPAGARLDDRWTRIARPDVRPALRADPGLDGRSEPDALQGFLAHATGLPAGGLHISVDLGPDGVVHRPLDARPGDRDALHDLLDATFPLPAAAAAAVERHLLPLLDGLEAARAPSIAGVEDIGFQPGARTAVLMGFGPDLADLLPRLAIQAVDPDRTGIVVAAPARALRAAVPEIRRLAAFHDLKVRLVFCDDVAVGLDAMTLGAREAGADWLALVPDHVVPAAPGTIRALLAAARAAGPDAAVAPTLLHDDGTVRWAGPARKGRPAQLMGLKGRIAVEMLSAECCVVPRQAFLAAGGYRGPLTGRAGRGEALGRRLAAAGVRSFWLADAIAIATDPPRPAERIARLADRLLLASPVPTSAREGRAA